MTPPGAEAEMVLGSQLPVISFSSEKNPRLRLELMLQLTGTL